MKSTYVLWRGQSAHNGASIRLVASNIVKASVNPKTGPMIQLWILPDAQDKLTDIVRRGDDDSVCGDCALRPFLAKARGNGATKCYVTIHQAPNAVHRSTHDKPTEWKQGWKAIAQSRRRVRCGSYGGMDALPAAVAVKTMQMIGRL